MSAPQKKPKNLPAIALTPDDVIPHARCPVCGGNDLLPYFELTFHQITIPYQRCRDCDLVFMNPVPNQDWYDRLYGQAFWETKSAKSALEKTQARQKQLIKELQRTDKLCATLDAAGCSPKPGARLLEIGCAFGLIISSIAEHYQAAAFGVEPSGLAAGFAQTLGGVEIIASTIDQLSEMEPGADQKMDVILFSHVMENVVDLNKVFKAIDRWLAPDGVVLMETPNSTVQNSTHIYHPYCFSQDSLRRLYGGNGFEIVSLRASGRPSSTLLPRYLTLVARRGTGGKQTSRSGPNSGFDRRLGHGWRQAIKRTPLVLVDRILTSLLYAPDEAAKRRAGDLAQAHLSDAHLVDEDGG